MSAGAGGMTQPILDLSSSPLLTTPGRQLWRSTDSTAASTMLYFTFASCCPSVHSDFNGACFFLDGVFSVIHIFPAFCFISGHTLIYLFF